MRPFIVCLCLVTATTLEARSEPMTYDDFVYGDEALVGSNVEIGFCHWIHASLFALQCYDESTPGSPGGALTVDVRSFAPADLKQIVETCAGYQEDPKCRFVIRGTIASVGRHPTAVATDISAFHAD